MLTILYLNNIHALNIQNLDTYCSYYNHYWLVFLQLRNRVFIHEIYEHTNLENYHK